ncbi:hypothetical protein B0J13DRAFT_580996 [Dactylonectria estremocensis]|uniref:DUF6546 domain-containing protein n=1 Tax=Dactylonectria estremocensis TaxID=1079267 RepID=A0A9P9JFU5_9HYPO|nr:hypothetical protein B0J13DRAFT_580996 [Dactylonectria estremocensis]
MAVNRASWDGLPAEIRRMVLDTLLHNFARIKVTVSRLADFGHMVYRNRALVRYIWFCLELEEYDCTMCAPPEEVSNVNHSDSKLVTTAFLNLVSTLSTWEPNGELLLDISAHSPSDSEHWFKYLTFEPDTPGDDCFRNRCVEQEMLAKMNNHPHRSISHCRASFRAEDALYKIFGHIMSPEHIFTYKSTYQWWQLLPSVPAVTGVLLRQQTRRRWDPFWLERMFSLFPRLHEIHYEPWRRWDDHIQETEDEDCRSLFKLLASSIVLRTLVLFENFDQKYQRSFWDCKGLRTPTLGLSQEVAKASLNLERLSASFMVEASYFFLAPKPSWKWLNMTSLALTSLLLTPTMDPAGINNMLRSAAEAAKKMTKLQTMEIWNGRKGQAMLFKYQLIGGVQPASLTCRGTVVVKKLLDSGTVIKSHGDAIHYLKLSKSGIRPVSLQQIRMEHRIREGVHNL